MAELTETVEAAAPATKTKKKTYADLVPTDVIVYEVTMRHTVVDEDEIEIKPEKSTKSATKAFWEMLPKYTKGKKEGQAKDINEGLKNPTLIGYIENGKVIKF